MGWLPDIFPDLVGATRSGKVDSWVEWRVHPSNPTPIPRARWVYVQGHIDSDCDNEVLHEEVHEIPTEPHPDWTVGRAFEVTYRGIPYRRVQFYGRYGDIHREASKA